LNEKWSLIEEKFAPKHFILFGSRVNGTQHEWSDIDAIIVSDIFDKNQRLGRSAKFKTMIDVQVAMDIFCYTPEEFDIMRVGIGVIADSCREGVWLR
jgi:predicted nucleotidyltransferase